MPPLHKTALAFLLACFMPLFALRAQQPPAESATKEAPKAKDAATSSAKGEAPKETPSDPIARIKEEGLKRSQVMATLSYLTDVIGPRLTGSPAMKRANEWTKQELTKWGLQNAHIEQWGQFGRGWSLSRFSAQVIEPQCIPLIAYPKAWSPGVEGTLAATVAALTAKTESDLAKYKGKLKGAIVLTSPPRPLAPRFEPLATRLTDGDLLALADAGEPGGRGSFPRPPANERPAATASAGATPSSGTGGGNSNGDGSDSGFAPEEPQRPRRSGGRGPSPFERKRLQFLIDEGAALLIEPSSVGDGGTLFVSAVSVPGPAPAPNARRISAWDKDAPKTIPQLVVATEHYNRLVRMIEQGESLKLAVELDVRFHDDDPTAYNTVAEIPGSDLKNEVVMLGGHMDSWHSGTGATDNAAGVAVAMEAVRILKALDLKPRRTIRIALWTGEEQGMRGSRGYVTEHFGKSPRLPAYGSAAETSKSAPDSTPKPEFEAFSAYFNLDNGTGKIRGVYLQGNEAVRSIFRKWLQPFREMGASTLSLSNTGGTDHESFDAVGLPGFQFIQDRIEYGSRTHHSNQDVFDRIQADDMKQASIIMAAFVYNTAMRDEKLPRKPRAGSR